MPARTASARRTLDAPLGDADGLVRPVATSEGLELRPPDEDDAAETGRREPQSLIVTTALVGVILAAMRYFLDVR